MNIFKEAFLKAARENKKIAVVVDAAIKKNNADEFSAFLDRKIQRIASLKNDAKKTPALWSKAVSLTKGLEKKIKGGSYAQKKEFNTLHRDLIGA